jgi:hypothetical protein
MTRTATLGLRFCQSVWDKVQVRLWYRPFLFVTGCQVGNLLQVPATQIEHKFTGMDEAHICNVR